MAIAATVALLSAAMTGLALVAVAVLFIGWLWRDGSDD